MGATGPSPFGNTTRFSPMIAPSRVTRHACTASGMSSTPQIGRALGENQRGRAGLPPLRLDLPGSVSTSTSLSIRGWTMPEIVVRLTPARRANSARLVGPRSNRACMTSPRFAVPTTDDESNDRCTFSDAPSAKELGSAESGRPGARLAARSSIYTSSLTRSVTCALRSSILFEIGYRAIWPRPQLRRGQHRLGEFERRVCGSE